MPPFLRLDKPMKIPGLGALKFHTYTRPLDALDVWLGRRRLPAISDSIRQLKPLPRPEQPPRYSVAYLTGDRFLYQTVFSIYSLLKTSQQSFRLRIVSDGSLSEDSISILEHLFPGTVSVEHSTAQDQRIEVLFPESKFPLLRRVRRECALFRKLLDVHGGAEGWQLFVDSDTFFFRSPDLLLRHLQTATTPCFMFDHWSNYGHPVQLLEQLAGHKLIRNLNSGLVGMRSETIDWERLEYWLGRMLDQGGRFVFFEQGITAMLLSLSGAAGLPQQDYILSPSRRETVHPTGVFHHYAGNSKFRFLRFNVPRRLFVS